MATLPYFPQRSSPSFVVEDLPCICAERQIKAKTSHCLFQDHHTAEPVVSSPQNYSWTTTLVVACVNIIHFVLGLRLCERRRGWNICRVHTEPVHGKTYF